jgi:hypothetical protein
LCGRAFLLGFGACNGHVEHTERERLSNFNMSYEDYRRQTEGAKANP